ncbi:hypothetical protein [Pelagicoccus mobilis]|uniref:PqqD family protein n=1 Tax=Pelagicoccus mobilis TaxID=415221 RepID=A0A934VR33_9BACT|nr:hypothetical protein [Pelagicoccus mobilis]MBK1877193.1 hypothetical protein [Pelagicoccus mobilis]
MKSGYKEIHWPDALKARIYLSRTIRDWDRKEDRSLVVEMPVKQRWYMNPFFSALFPFRQTKKIGIDPVGACILDRCIGGVSLESLIDWFAEEERLDFHESRLLVVGYLRTLMVQELVVIDHPAGKESWF